MVNVPWTIYRENLHTQYSDQWELLLYDSIEDMRAYDPSLLSNRMLAYDNGGIISWLGDVTSIPQSRIKKISFPTPFPNLKTRDLPNKVNVYNEASFDSRDVSITFTEDVKFTGFKYFYNWYSQIYLKNTRQFRSNADTVYRYASIVFKDKQIIDRPSMRFNLHKLKLVGFDESIMLDYEAGKPVEFTAKMKVEDVTFESYIKTKEEMNGRKRT